MVSSILGNRVPVTMTALEALTRLLGVLEEVDTDMRLLLHEPLMLKLTSACSAVRHQVSGPLPPRLASLKCSGLARVFVIILMLTIREGSRDCEDRAQCLS